MKRDIKKIISNNAPIKIVSLILGFMFWVMVSQSHFTEIWLTVPLCFDSEQTTQIINAPETIRIGLAGKRSDLFSIDTDTLAVHFKAQQLSLGNNTITIDAKNLFLPDTIKLINYNPSPITIEVTQNSLKE